MSAVTDQPKRSSRQPISCLATTLLALILAGCPAADPEPADDAGGSGTQLEILSVEGPSPLVVGSRLRVSARGLLSSGSERLLRVRDVASGRAFDLSEATTADTTNPDFAVSEGIVFDLGAGSHSAELVLQQGDRASAPFAFQLELANELPLRLDEVTTGQVFRNDEAVIRGDGFIDADEGVLEAVVAGTFEEEGGASRAVNARLRVEPAERFTRERGLLRLTTAVGGMMPGRFTGDLHLESTLRNGAQAQSAPLPVTWEFGRPALFAIEPTEIALGQRVTVRGAGLLGSPSEPDETTVIRLEGTFAPLRAAPLSFGPSEEVVLYRSGQEAEWVIDYEVSGRQIYSALFGFSHGRFEGTATPVTLRLGEELVGEPLSVQLDLTVRQPVVVSFLQAYYDSLRHFGLSAASTRLEAIVFERLRTIYSGLAMDFYSTPPENFIDSAISNVEIGGPDPNGLGLLGYDNTPGKDVGNVRLFDRVGGTNAQTQADGFPGYGGVFIDSFLYWSANPGFSGTRPFGAPAPDPLFDDVFGAVRAQPASLDEVNGIGDASRVAAVERAVNALGSLVGEVTAHELGHSLGLAQPFGPPDAYHSEFPGEGCLMDAGADRPFGERAALEGFTPTRFCFDEEAYLLEILPD